MIDNVSVKNENMNINTGEGYQPSPPPPPSQTSKTQGSSSSPAVKVELSQGVQESPQGTSTEVQATEVTGSDKTSVKDGEKELNEKLQQTIDALNDKLARMDREVQFKVDKRIDKNYISVIDKKSQEILREFPPEEIRSFIAKFDEINEKLSMSQDVKSLVINLEV